jgi:hypothetical protein
MVEKANIYFFGLGKTSYILMFPPTVDPGPQRVHKITHAVFHREKGTRQDAVHRRDAGSVRNKMQWLRIAAQNDTLELAANGFGAGGPATVTTEGVAFVWYARMLEIVKSYNTKEITISITPAGMTINTFQIGRSAWYAIFDKPELAPESMETVYKGQCPPDPAEALEVMRLWHEMRLRSK